MNEIYNDDDLIERIWSAIIEKQQSLNKQMDKSLDKINQEREKGNRLIEESEKNYFKKIDRKNLEMKELDTRIHRQLEENKLKADESEIEENENGILIKRKKKSKIRKRKTSKNKAESRYEDYGFIYDAISEAELENEEKQALMEAVSAVQQKFAKPV